MEKIKTFVKKNADLVVISVLTTLAVGALKDNVSARKNES